MKRILKCLLLIVFIAFLAFVLVTETAHSDSYVDNQTDQDLNPIISGAIDPEIFSQSVPRRMDIGETYLIVLAVTNTGNMEGDFLVFLDFPLQTLIKYFYTLTSTKRLTLDSGESQRVEFYVTPVSAYEGSLAIAGNLYSLASGEAVLVDSVSATVYGIRTVLSVVDTIWIVVVIGFLVFVVLAIKFLRKPSSRAGFWIAFLLFLVALSLRAPNLLRVAVYPDETLFRGLGWDILHNNWVWRKWLMWMYPPLYFYLSATLTYLFGGGSLEALRGVSAITGSLTVAVTYFLGSSLFGKKVGLFSAFLLCFSPFHILYSRIAYTEALTLFFITTATYFFWLGYKNKSWTKMCISGIFFGLALNTKYIAGIPVVAAILFIVWIEKSWKPLLRRDFLVWLTTILVVMSPVQLLLLQNGVNPYWWYLDQAFGEKPLLPGWKGLPVLEFVPRSLSRQVYMGARVASPWLPWLPAFELVIVILFVVTILYHVHSTLKARVYESFLMLFFLPFLLFFAINPWRIASHVVYAQPYYFVMLSSLAVHYARALRNNNMRPIFGVDVVKRVLRTFSCVTKVFVLLCIAIFVFSNVVVGVMAPAIDTGEFEGGRLAILYIKSRVDQGDIISGWWGLAFYQYYINLYDINVTYVPLEKVSSESTPSFEELPTMVRTLDDFVLTTLKPRFIIIARSFLDYSFNATMKEVLLANYELVWLGRPPVGYFWTEEKNFQTWLVFERSSP